MRIGYSGRGFRIQAETDDEVEILRQLVGDIEVRGVFQDTARFMEMGKPFVILMPMRGQKK